jgi:molybdate transport system ATP-binding protein
LADSFVEHPLPFATVQLRHRIGPLDIDVDFKLTQPWTILFGASGSGKTTILRAMAGLIRPNDAAIAMSAFRRQVVAVDTITGTFVPIHQRRTRLAAQQAALFPHMTVRENVGFGARMTSDGTSVEEFVDLAVDQFHLADLLQMMPGELSGGERQRVAIARAVTSAISLTGGAMLLLDEPFTGMDSLLRDSLIADLRRSLAVHKIPVLSVTHDVAEAFQLGAEVIKIADGKVVAQGPVEVVLAEERKRLLGQLGAADGLSASTEPYLGG